MTQTTHRKIVGIDGGGSGCRVVVADAAGVILGRAEGGAANIATDYDSTRRNILETTQQAYRNAGFSDAHFSDDVAFLGLAGANLGRQARQLEADLPFHRQRVIDDRRTTVQGALGDADGCVALIGTGSFFVGRHGGVFDGIGGWGFHLGDDASGARLGKQLLRRVIHCHDGLVPHSDLTREVLARFGGTPKEVVEFARSAKPGDYGKFARQMAAALDHDDAAATEIFNAEKDVVQRALDRVGLAAGDPLCMLGGLGPTFQRLLDPEYQAHCQPPKGNALEGAVALARREFAAELEPGA